DGWTALHLAAETGQAGAAALLLDAGAGVAAREKKNAFTPLHVAAVNGQHAVVRLLVAAGADVGARDRMGVTALVLAAQRGCATSVKMLLDAGAKV
ncbi:ankyrin repeat-containing domain protein, partial [Baffinella frigidus]